ncbi:hypothetical protein GGR57DRAFT_454085 [Xylariaceae sp. FL1272]|nr:hypothetical protein GGR57DRAFT_454085 [Xylariaceae sp. FL1272]
MPSSSQVPTSRGSSSRVPPLPASTSPVSPSPETLYITLQYLRTVDGKHKYHWGLYLTGRKAPRGLLVHATDMHRKALDLYKEFREVKNPLLSKTMVMILKIGSSISPDVLKSHASSVHLMDPKYLPSGEPQWTCRVWVKEVLRMLQIAKVLILPCSIQALETHCQTHADNFLPFRSRGPPAVVDHLKWAVSEPSRSNSDPRTMATHGRHYGPSPMVIDSSTKAGSRYYGSSPMVIDSTTQRHYGSSPMVIDSTNQRYYGLSPMVTETHRR